VFNQHGQRIGAVNETGQSTLKKAVRLLTSYDQYLTHRYEVLHADGAVALRLTRPAKLVKSSIIVSNGADQAIGTIRQDNVFGKIHFSLEAANGVELAGVELPHRRPHRTRGRTYHQDIRGVLEELVHHCRQLRGADS
jgi:hypothetical protein